MIKHAIYVALAACLASVSLLHEAHALDQIIRPYQSVRSSGMGGVRLTTGNYDENFFGNPARLTADPTWKISLVDFMVETSKSTLDSVSALLGSGDTLSKIGSTAGNNNHARIQTAFPAVYLPNWFGGKTSLAVALLSSTQFDIDLRRSYAIDPTAYTDIGPAVIVARKFLEDDSLSVGVTTHATYRLASQTGFSLIDLIRGKSIAATKSGGQGAHIDFDVGSTYILPVKWQDVEFSAAASINNLLGGNYSNLKLHLIDSNARPPAQPRSYGFGFAARKAEWWKATNTSVAVEFTDIGNNPNGSLFRLVHMGFETRFLNFLVPRVGINQGYLCAGATLDFRVLQLDLATYGEEMSLNVGGLQDRRYAVRIAVEI